MTLRRRFKTSQSLLFPFFKCFLLLIFSISVNAQAIQSADSLYRKHQYRKSALTYFKVFNQNNIYKTNNNLLAAARACSKARLTDSVFNFLFIIAKRQEFELYDAIIYDPVFIEQHYDKRWQRLSVIVARQKQTFKAAVSNELITTYHERYQMERRDSVIANHYGNNSLKRSIFLDTIKRADSINTLKLKSILNTYSVPGIEEIGEKGIVALIYIYQKSPIPFQKRYFSFIAEAFRKGEIVASKYAAIADGISLFDTGQQIYGTQLKAVSGSLYPIENRDSVNIRRQSIGLGPIFNN